MSQAHTSSEFSLPWSKSGIGVHIHGCRWAWCRLTFSSNKELVHHVIDEHVRRAVPVMRRDIPMLKRAEEGFGESISMTGIMGGSNSSTGGDGAISAGVAIQDNSSPLQLDSEVDHPSSLPSPPATIPMAQSPFPLLNLNHAPILSYRSPDPAGGSSQNRDHHHERASSPPKKIHTAATSANMYSTFETPTTPQPGSTLSHQSNFQTPTFKSLSSADSPWIPLPVSPPFDSLVADAVGAARGHGADPGQSVGRDRFQSLSQDTQNSHSSSVSQDIVNQQLTQSQDMEVDADNDATKRVDRDHVMATGSGSISLSNKNEGSTDSYPAGHGQSANDLYAAELPWSSDQGRGAATSHNASIDEASSESQPPTQSQRKTHPQSKPRSQLRLPFETPLPSPPVPRPPQIQRQAWYQAPLPHLRAKSLKSPIVKSPTMNGNRTGSSSRSESRSQMSLLLGTRLQSGSPTHESRNGGHTPTHSASRNVFRSGSLQISPTELKIGRVGELLGPQFSAKDHGNVDESMVSCDGIQVSQPHSQSSQLSSGTFEENTPAFSYLQLQTQAPYRSQSLSQV